MSNLDKVLIIASDFFKKDNIAVSIGTKHKNSTELTILIAGRIEFNPYEHRRDAFDIMCKYNLWFKKLKNGFYESGSHYDNITETRVGIKPTNAITDMSYALLMEL